MLFRSLFLARKVNPFSGEDEIMQSLRMRKKHADDTMKMTPANLQTSDKIEGEIQNFMRLRKSNIGVDKEVDHTSLLRTTNVGKHI